MRVLALGDIVGRSGRQMIYDHLPHLRVELGITYVIANAENASGGLGLTARDACDLHATGVDILTTGNHVWRYPDLNRLLDSADWLIRPANFPEPAPGRGVCTITGDGIRPDFVVLNVQGRTFMNAVDCPFAVAERLLEDIPTGAIIVLDMHAEATSEKRAIAHMLRGKVHGILGTHTHVLTNDACILDNVTGYITDLGMCGPQDSCLGMDNDIILRKFRTGRPEQFRLAKGPAMLNGALLDFEQHRCTSITSWRYKDGEKII